MTAFGPTDLVALMDPLTPSSAMRVYARPPRRSPTSARARRPVRRLYAAAERRGRSTAECGELAGSSASSRLRHPGATATAIQAAAAHLGTLREGRKTMIVVTEGLRQPGPPGRGPDRGLLLDIVRTANSSNTAVHAARRPRGLMGAGWGLG